ncbi:MAG: hypothetical protein ABMA64_27170 [Myxococcota bacterium]
MWLLAVASAWADSGRLAIGVVTGSGIAPVEPTWVRDQATAAVVGCGGATGWWVTGGHDYAGPRGEVKRTADDRRWGLLVDSKNTDLVDLPSSRYAAVAPFVKPALAIGLAVPPGMSFELGPYAVLAPPLVQSGEPGRAGAFYGHAGVELSVLVGSASPQRAAR